MSRQFRPGSEESSGPRDPEGIACRTILRGDVAAPHWARRHRGLDAAQATLPNVGKPLETRSRRRARNRPASFRLSTK